MSLKDRTTEYESTGIPISSEETAEDHKYNESRLLSRDSEKVPLLSVVMPTLNEEQGIRGCIQRVEQALEELDIFGEVIVSDSSTDRTPQIAEECGAIVVKPDKRGYGYAYRYAFEFVRGRYIAIGDADATYDFAELPKLFEPVARGDADMTMGSRLNGTILPGSMPKLHQYIGNPLLTAFLNLCYGAGVSDAHSGMRVISREALNRLNLESDGMEFASEMIMEAGSRDITIGEVPITYHPRKGEATLESFSDGWRHVRFMLLNAPKILFTFPGTVLSLLGLSIMTLSYIGISLGGIIFGAQWMFAGSLLTLVGYQVVMFGFFVVVAGQSPRLPDDIVTRWVLDHFRLERGATLGIGLFGLGSGYVTWELASSIANGFTRSPSIKADILAFTIIVLGLQILFGSFFLSTVKSQWSKLVTK